MTHTYVQTFRYDDTIREAFEAIKERDGIPYHEQIRRGVLMWIASKEKPAKRRKKRRAATGAAATPQTGRTPDASHDDTSTAPAPEDAAPR